MLAMGFKDAYETKVDLNQSAALKWVPTWTHYKDLTFLIDSVKKFNKAALRNSSAQDMSQETDAAEPETPAKPRCP